MSQSLKHPTVQVALAIHEQVIAADGGSQEIRSQVLLESALAAPQATKMWKPIITDPVEIASAYFLFLWSNQPFVLG